MERDQYEQTYRFEDWHWWFAGRHRLTNALFERWIGGDRDQRILDVGCGTGGNLFFLERWGRVIGLDLKALPLSLARSRQVSGLVQASVVALPFPGESFSLITAFDVLYHRWIEDDRQAIREFYRLIRPGGWLLVTDSALPFLWSPHDELYYARQRYMLPEIQAKLSRAGFQPYVCSYANTLLLPFTMTHRLLKRWFSLSGRSDLRDLPAWLNRLLIAIRDLEVAWIKQGGKFPCGSSLVCLAQKPLVE